MSENSKKPEIEYNAYVSEPAGTRDEDFIVTAIGFGRKASEKYEITWPLFRIPQVCFEACPELADVNTACVERYGADLNEMFAFGVRNLTTKPPYQAVGFNDDGTLKDGGHKAMQDLADGYKVGQRASGGGGVKAKAAKFDSAKNELAEIDTEAVSKEELLERMRKAGLLPA